MSLFLSTLLKADLITAGALLGNHPWFAVLAAAASVPLEIGYVISLDGEKVS